MQFGLCLLCVLLVLTCWAWNYWKDEVNRLHSDSILGPLTTSQKSTIRPKLKLVSVFRGEVPNLDIEKTPKKKE